MTIPQSQNVRNPLLNFKERQSPHRAQRLRVRAIGTLAGWSFRVSDDLTRLPISLDFGTYPAWAHWDDATRTLYALAQAARRIRRDMPDAVVVMACCAQPSPQRQLRTARRAA